jgi:hypothetical protein
MHAPGLDDADHRPHGFVLLCTAVYCLSEVQSCMPVLALLAYAVKDAG